MKSSDIKEGETYMFMGSESPTRAHLAGEPFTVVQIKAVWRRQFKKSKRVKRFFNAEGIGARADELEPMPEREWPCPECEHGGIEPDGSVHPNGTQVFKCDECGHTLRFP
jgi:hypothetical protein